MKKLTALGANPSYLDRYIAIRDSKHLATRVTLQQMHAHIEGRFKTFDDAATSNTLHSINTSNAALLAKDALRSCYTVKTKKLVDLKNEIKSVQAPRLLKYCPMCGVTRPLTHDHYLPAVTFPEFSVHALNLVPCCSACNSIKDDDWLSAAGSRQYLHAYFDAIPEIQYVTVQLVTNPLLSTVGVKFAINQAGVADPIWSLIESHYRRLKLITRYNELASDEIEGIFQSCASHLEAGGTDAKKFLRIEAGKEAATYGMNNWRALLMNSLLSHRDFDEWVEARLPGP